MPKEALLYKADSKSMQMRRAVRNFFLESVQNGNAAELISNIFLLSLQHGKNQPVAFAVSMPPFLVPLDVVCHPLTGSLTLGYNHLSKITHKGEVHYSLMYFEGRKDTGEICFTEMALVTPIAEILALGEMRDLNRFEQLIVRKALGGIYLRND